MENDLELVEDKCTELKEKNNDLEQQVEEFKRYSYGEIDVTITVYLIIYDVTITVYLIGQELRIKTRLRNLKVAIIIAV